MTEIENKVRSVMAIVFNIDGKMIPDNAKLNEFEGWDSLNHMNILLSLEDEFGIEFSDEEIVKVDSFPELVSVVFGKT